MSRDLMAGELVAFDLASQEQAEQVVLWFSEPLVEHGVEVGIDRVRGRLLHGDGLGAPVRRPADVVGADHPVLHAQKDVEVLDRQSEKDEEDLGGEQGREFGGEVDAGSVAEAIDEGVGEVRDRLLQLGHLAGCEQRVEELSVLLVVGRVDLERDERPDVLQVDGRHVRRKQLGDS